MGKELPRVMLPTFIKGVNEALVLSSGMLLVLGRKRRLIYLTLLRILGFMLASSSAPSLSRWGFGGVVGRVCSRLEVARS